MVKIKYNGQYVQAKNYDVPNLEWMASEVKDVTDFDANKLLLNKDFVLEEKTGKDFSKILVKVQDAKSIQELRIISKEHGLKAKDTSFNELKEQIIKEIRGV